MTDAAIIKYQISVLVRLVAGMFAVAGLAPGGPALSAMPDGVRRQILRVLQPAESALRRVIFIAARKRESLWRGQSGSGLSGRFRKEQDRVIVLRYSRYSIPASGFLNWLRVAVRLAVPARTLATLMTSVRLLKPRTKAPRPR